MRELCLQIFKVTVNYTDLNLKAIAFVRFLDSPQTY